MIDHASYAAAYRARAAELDNLAAEAELCFEDMMAADFAARALDCRRRADWHADRA